MKRVAAGFNVAMVALLQIQASTPSTITIADARQLVYASIPKIEQTHRGLVMDLDREHEGCAVYHVYRDRSDLMAFTIGFWSIDVRTGEVWDESTQVRVTNERVAQIQRAIASGSA
jgi:hypothetical protein